VIELVTAVPLPKSVLDISVALPFVDTYRTMCIAADPVFRRVLEEIRNLWKEHHRPRYLTDSQSWCGRAIAAGRVGCRSGGRSASRWFVSGNRCGSSPMTIHSDESRAYCLVVKYYPRARIAVNRNSPGLLLAALPRFCPCPGLVARQILMPASFCVANFAEEAQTAKTCMGGILSFAQALLFVSQKWGEQITDDGA